MTKIKLAKNAGVLLLTFLLMITAVGMSSPVLGRQWCNVMYEEQELSRTGCNNILVDKLYTVYFGGISGSVGIILATGWGFCGLNVVCYDGSDLVVACEPAFSAYHVGGYIGPATFYVNVTDYGVQTDYYQCPPGEPGLNGYGLETFCIVDNFYQYSTTGPCWME